MGKKIPSLIAEVFSYLFKKPATHKYPFEKPVIAEGFRGKPVFLWDRCVECGVCEDVCPAFAIKLRWTDGRFVPWYDVSRCCFCYECIYNCPTNAIISSTEFELSSVKKSTYEGLPKVPTAPYVLAGLEKVRYMKIDYSKCVECELCAAVCPTHAITMVIKDGRVIPSYDVDLCVFCHKCVEICPTEAISPEVKFPEKAEKAPEKVPESPLEKAGLLRYRTIQIDRNICTGCTLCARVCPTEAITMKDVAGRLLPIYNINKCLFCGQCYEACPVDAIKFLPDLPPPLRRKKR